MRRNSPGKSNTRYLVVLHGKGKRPQLEQILTHYEQAFNKVYFIDSKELFADIVTKLDKDCCIIGFNTGIIVPQSVLERVGEAFNYHAAPPSYPGRDPHHWAVYEGATVYGVTLHIMTEKVDTGPILAVRGFPIPSSIRPLDLRSLAEAELLSLFKETIEAIALGNIKPINTVWSGKRRTRKDFIEICRITSDITESEFKRRYWAFETPSHSNLHVVIHGKVFRIEKSGDEINSHISKKS